MLSVKKRRSLRNLISLSTDGDSLYLDNTYSVVSATVSITFVPNIN